MIAGWLHAGLLAGVVMVAAPASGVFHDARDAVATVGAASTHDFHVSYTRMAIEPTVISAQIRLFTDDMTRALVERSRSASFALNSPQADAAFLAYVTEHFVVTANGRRLLPVVASSSADGQMWSYVVTWTSPVTITSVAMHNAVLMELFDDQQNIVKFRHIASGKESTLFFSGGSKADQVVRF